MSKQTARMENWSVCECYGGGQVLVGSIKDHPQQGMFHSDTQQSSLIIKMDRANGLCETENTIYTLGRENEAFKGAY